MDLRQLRVRNLHSGQQNFQTCSFLSGFSVYSPSPRTSNYCHSPGLPSAQHWKSHSQNMVQISLYPQSYANIIPVIAPVQQWL